ncbi:exodeoxyribonuclease V subunit beta [Dyella dinghuensis]|uniref:RecBCD enzyme subunit RecB n=1 Tax=Dyella dinghuensis TaxID=1920169 RepID=A0A3S0PIP9_9GAMM|nr:exodeoxyribonuclease V subunit beta [Dyella dinghuensis]RUL66576.1 exodeoxyribonuclease V subunit beta [Dyella dinghuensis]
MSAVAPLDPLRLPLQGIRLIEASAGTGKTWTLAALYLRLVLGHGGQPSQLPAQILVVTFTRAATAELRERIRDRLATAAAAFRDQLIPDDFLRDLIAEYPDANERAAAARQLDLAAQWMDEAAIYTIHGWCQRMLAQHAFEGSDTPGVIVDENARLMEAVRDYWRRFYAPLDDADAAAVASVWNDPPSLQRAVKPLLYKPLNHLRMQGHALPVVNDLVTALHERTQPQHEAENAARTLWSGDADAIEAMLRTATINRSLKNTSYKPDNLDRDMAALRAWAEGADADRKLVGKYGQATLKESTSKNGVTPVHAAFAAVQTLSDLWDAEQPLAPLLLAHAAPWITARVEKIRERQAIPGFDDMLRQLDAALKGPHGEQLAQTIAAQYPLALIDEFQDTDPLQWQIFQRIYANRADTGLLLIGDPKQAIYGFRGADIHTYLNARDQAQTPTWTLTTNYRSEHGLVAAVNHIFEYADKQPHGAFGFGDGAHGLPFNPVQAHGLKNELQDHGQRMPALALHVLSDTSTLNVGSYISEAASHAAAHIVGMLNAARSDLCIFTDKANTQTPLRSRDIAVIVRNGREANAIRTALYERNVASVYVSERDSVYASTEAQDVLLWLQACALPSSDRAMRAALASTTMHRSVAELDRLNHDEAYWEACGEQFRTLQFIWQRHGALAMLQNLLHHFDLPSRWLAKSNGERVLTNLQHLAELLQHASTSLDGEYALIHYIAAQIRRADEHEGDTSEEHIVRLESEADLVRVITIHKAKGLQYPVVILPFICRFQDAPRGSVQSWHDDRGQSWIDLQPDAEACARIERERLQEDLRLLYVALTRAQYACWLGIACVVEGQGKKPVLHRSAFGYVLSGGTPIEAQDLLPRLQALCEGASDIHLNIANGPADITRLVHSANRTGLARPARHYALAPPEAWWIASYSALTHGAGDVVRQIAPETATQDVLTEAARESTERVVGDSDQGLHAFPRGAEPGTFLHDIFEWIAENGFASTVENPAQLEQYVARRCQRRGWQMWIVPLMQWLPALLRTPLPLPNGGTLTLDDLDNRQRYQAELEFWFEANHVDTQYLDQLVTQHTLNAESRPTLAQNHVNGMLKGFIDLIAEKDGRYYIVDYKSNWLGDNNTAYTSAAMREATLQSRYDLQYAIYTLALHRQLRARLPGYDYERHVGGVLYLYLRGIDHAGHGVHTERLPFALIDALDTLFEGARADVA